MCALSEAGGERERGVLRPQGRHSSGEGGEVGRPVQEDVARVHGGGLEASSWSVQFCVVAHRQMGQT